MALRRSKKQKASTQKYKAAIWNKPPVEPFQGRSETVEEFLARGGRIRRIPSAESTAIVTLGDYVTIAYPRDGKVGK
jgi:hypothetical protein